MEHKNTEVLQKTKMSTIGVVAIVFSFVAAGAFGIEEAISSSGPGITLALLVIFPFVWCFPVGEMVAELGSLLPTEGGVYSGAASPSASSGAGRWASGPPSPPGSARRSTVPWWPATPRSSST